MSDTDCVSMQVRRRLVALVVGASAAIGGAFVALRYHRLGLTLSHYDARGHLVVARRIFDSLTPGWQQIGALWLPLPHLLNALPVQVDLFYRTGASAVAMSIVSYAIAAAAIAWILVMSTGSAWAAVAGAAVFALNPNVLYLQATPMTEALLFGLMTFAVAMLIEWTAGPKSCPTPIGASYVGRVRSDPATGGSEKQDPPYSRSRSQALAGVLFALACLTRYEAWPVTGTALVLAAWARWRAGDRWRVAVRGVVAIAMYPAGAVLAFLVFSRVVGGQWLESSGRSSRAISAARASTAIGRSRLDRPAAKPAPMASATRSGAAYLIRYGCPLTNASHGTAAVVRSDTPISSQPRRRSRTPTRSMSASPAAATAIKPSPLNVRAPHTI